MEIKTESVDIKYEIGEEIGKGKFATVKRCRHRQTACEYAAKFIRKNRGAGRRGAKMENIEKEIQILSETNHRNIINLYEVYDTKREVILILELVDGGELFEYLSEKDKLSEEEASLFVRQILDGVEHLHSRHIAHLDLKPENILLQDKRSTSVKLIDFGLSRKILPKEDHRAIMGTAEFCAPEVISFEQLSVSTDMWSIGVITYILLSGLSPFLGDNQQETYHNITSINFEFDEEYFNGTSELAKDFIKKLLVKDTRKRATIHDCLNHPWIQPVEKSHKVLRRSSVINTEHLKKFIARQRWKRSMKVVSLCNRLSRSMQLRRIQSSDTLGSASEEDTDDLTETIKQESESESVEIKDKNAEDKHVSEDSVDVSDVAEEHQTTDAEADVKKISVSPVSETVKIAASEELCISNTAAEGDLKMGEAHILEDKDQLVFENFGSESHEENLDSHDKRMSETDDIESAATGHQQFAETSTAVTRLLETAETSISEYNEAPMQEGDGSISRNILKSTGPETAETLMLEFNETPELKRDEFVNGSPFENACSKSQDCNLDCPGTKSTEAGVIETAATEHQMPTKTDIFLTGLLETAETSKLELKEIHEFEIKEAAVLKIAVPPVKVDEPAVSDTAETADVWFSDVPCADTSETEHVDTFDTYKKEIIDARHVVSDKISVLQESGLSRMVEIHNSEVIEADKLKDSEMRTSENAESSHDITPDKQYSEAAEIHNIDGVEINSSNKVEIPESVLLEKSDAWKNLETKVKKSYMNFETKAEEEHFGPGCNTVIGQFDNDIGHYIKGTNNEEFESPEITRSGTSAVEQPTDQFEFNKGFYTDKHVLCRDDIESNNLVEKSEVLSENGRESQTLHIDGLPASNTGFYLEHDSRGYENQPVCDEELTYSKDITEGIDNSDVDIIAQELVSRIIEESLDLVLRETSDKRSVLASGAVSVVYPSKETNKQWFDFRGMEATLAPDIVNLPDQEPELKAHAKQYDPLHLACFEIDEVDEVQIEEVSGTETVSVEGKENDEDWLFKPLATSKFILPARKSAVTKRRPRPEVKMKKKARFWEMEDCHDTNRYEMFEMQVLNNSE